MSKQEFLAQLRKGLYGLPQDDIEERLAFYNEMIEDRKEEGLSEEEAVLAVGSIDEIVKKVVTDIPLTKIAKERIKPKRQLRALEIILLALGSPIWLSLGFAVFAVLLSLWVVLLSLMLSVWAIFVSIASCSVGGILSCIIFIIGANVASGVAMLAAGIVCAGLSIFMFYGCKSATKGTLLLTKKMAICIKNCFLRKEVA